MSSVRDICWFSDVAGFDVSRGCDDGETRSMVFVGECSSPYGVVACSVADGDCPGEESRYWSIGLIGWVKVRKARVNARNFDV
jgi:hypothetical protein